MENMIIALEGIDGAGKSSTIHYLINKYPNQIAVYKRTRKSRFIDKPVSSRFMRRCYMFQVPIYLALSHWDLHKHKSLLKKNSSRG